MEGLESIDSDALVIINHNTNEIDHVCKTMLFYEETRIEFCKLEPTMLSSMLRIQEVLFKVSAKGFKIVVVYIAQGVTFNNCKQELKHLTDWINSGSGICITREIKPRGHYPSESNAVVCTSENASSELLALLGNLTLTAWQQYGFERAMEIAKTSEDKIKEDKTIRFLIDNF